MDTATFDLASTAAERWIAFLADLADAIDDGDNDLACHALADLSQDLQLFGGVLSSPIYDDLADVAEQVVSHNGQAYGSAHEAAFSIGASVVTRFSLLMESTDDWREKVPELLRELRGALLDQSDTSRMHAMLRRERSRMLRRLDASPPDDASKKRRGRPRKDEKDSETLIIAALAKHHRYETGGSVGNYEPAGLDDLTSERVSKSTASRFLEKRFGSHSDYKKACHNRKIGRFLQLWQGELDKRLADLTPEEYGRRD